MADDASKLAAHEPLPSFAKQIDVSHRSLFSRHNVKGPTCHVGSLINKPDFAQRDVDRFHTNFAVNVPGDFVGVDLFPGPNVDVVADLCSSTFKKDLRSLSGGLDSSMRRLCLSTSQTRSMRPATSRP